MLKSISEINRIESLLESFKEEGIVVDFFIELRVNQKVIVYVALNDDSSFDISRLKNERTSNLNLEFITLKASEKYSVEYEHLFHGERVSYGLRRSMNTLLNPDIKKHDKKNVVTFYSYKGGVGRTTSLALSSSFLAKKGNNVFVIDCDLEAPGILNFFNTSQAINGKNGLVEYLNDCNFDKEVNIKDYVYNIEKKYSGEGVINLMPAGNILSSKEDTDSYLEGMAKIDFQGHSLTNTLAKLIKNINETYNPDVIMIDSRTGFNNILASLSAISSHVVFIAGDDIQNQPGIEYFSNYLRDNDISSSFVLSILSSNYTRRFENFKNYIESLIGNDVDTYYLDRQVSLELIGTPLEDHYDIEDIISGENGSAQYKKLFQHISEVVSLFSKKNNNISDIEYSQDPVNTQSHQELMDAENSQKYTDAENPQEHFDAEDYKKHSGKENEHSATLGCDDKPVNDIVLDQFRSALPDLYAENINYTEEYMNKYFYYRPCMEDLLIAEKNILLGDKGTGKTAFYKALKIPEFFNQLVKKAQKSHLNYKVINITNMEVDNFEFLGFEKEMKNELFIRDFWLFFIWNAIFQRGGIETENKHLFVNLSEPSAQNKIITILKNHDNIVKVSNDLNVANLELKGKDQRLIITFDQLDNIVKPLYWNDVIAPLVKMATKFPYDYIQPKLFLRRDLYDRLGNLTNKNSFSSKVINLEWNQNEIFSYFLKIVFSFSKESFFEFLKQSDVSLLLLETVRRKIRSKGKDHNQVPLDNSLIEPLINAFFGYSKALKSGKKRTAYEDLYRNIQSADGTVNLRPFIDLITNAIAEQDEKDDEKRFRGNTIIGLAYCTSKTVRKNAVVKYLGDLWNEKGNEFVKCFCIDFSKNQIDPKYKKSSFTEDGFESLLLGIKNRNKKDYPEIIDSTIDDLKLILIATKIITPYLVGNSTRYRIAYLYTNYLGL
ncbi:KGGVGR-motif variant AAA ATPase [Enterobacter asburiae]|uniref:KGGVGR-motif variant AAA ATPase n=1 Tax=Enterobacter asburiae TaxID=61645 RepID=UPI001881498D|nr:AAA family ATPase [Enterobacter asburiae]MBE8906844.1 AAA family ATPase [Enterobacter asburiae]